MICHPSRLSERREEKQRHNFRLSITRRDWIGRKKEILSLKESTKKRRFSQMKWSFMDRWVQIFSDFEASLDFNLFAS